SATWTRGSGRATSAGWRRTTCSSSLRRRGPRPTSSCPARACERVGAGQAGVRRIRREQRADVLLRAARPRRPARLHAAEELEEREGARRDLVVAALAVEGEDLDRPRADAGDGSQPFPALFVVGI